MFPRLLCINMYLLFLLEELVNNVCKIQQCVFLQEPQNALETLGISESIYKNLFLLRIIQEKL